MPRFFSFNQKSTPYKVLQAYNLYCALSASLDYMQNPDSQLSELSADVLIHLWTAFSLQTTTHGYPSMFSLTLNSARLGSIYTGMMTGVGALSTGVDAATHLINFVASGLNVGRDTTEDPAPAKIKTM